MSKMILRQLLILLSSLVILTFFTFGLTLFFPIESRFQLLDTTQAPDGLVEQYVSYIKHIITGDWGFSQSRGTDVLKEFFIYFPATVELVITALLLALSLGIPLGITAAQNKNKWPDKLVVSSTLVGYSMPIFWWGMLLVLFFSLSLGVTPVASRLGFEYDIIPVTGFMLIDTLLSDQPYAIEAFYDALHHLILPAIVLATIPLAIFTRVTRSAMIKVLASDYIRTAKAKGLSHGRIIWIHALRNAMLPILTIIGLQISVLITGTLITETIFSWPGVGKWLLEAVYRRDFVTLHAGLLATASLVIMINIAVELMSFYVNPKMRLQE
ncbi:ABC transporter permease subunit [Aliikangiella coralliicola]|uniref:ABC transporter permease subunit n=1 Tax=Aliikangiella coralliicola TaxID=2592383 RepID=A0A545UB06_9GAMM|nr:ABC transporter permease subunit [Aliikangiella coralliicola]TQV86613.1 ABC transporter permease subunit [Aliikangiella coralliicola]